MKTYLKLLVIMTMFLIFTSAKVTHAILPTQDVTIKTSKDNIDINEEFYLYLTSSKCENLYSLSFELKYNTEILEILSVEPGSFFENEKIESNKQISPISNDTSLLFYYETLTGNHPGKTSDNPVELVKIKAKLLKKSMVPLNIINTKNNLFVGTPNIRLIMVDSNLNRNNYSSSTSYIQTKNFSTSNDIRLFISDVYKKTFLRDPEEYGLNYWFNKLISQEYSVRSFLINILNEKEFIQKDLSNEEFVSSMYSIIANREPDQDGYTYWLNMLIELEKQMDIKLAKSKIILLICNEGELNERSNKINLKY